MNNLLTIAIDGPSGAGKSTIAKEIAAILDMEYIDTGAMYRAIGYKLQREGVPIEDPELLAEALETTVIDFVKGDIILDGEVINDKIRSPEVSQVASQVSAKAAVRNKLVALQQAMGDAKSVSMDGRDIGTVVLPHASFKFYITASTRERAIRRWKELTEKGKQISLEEVESAIIQRDYNDTTREVTPLRKAEDAMEIDTTNMTKEDVVNRIIEVVKNGNSKTFSGN